MVTAGPAEPGDGAVAEDARETRPRDTRANNRFQPQQPASATRTPSSDRHPAHRQPRASRARGSTCRSRAAGGYEDLVALAPKIRAAVGPEKADRRRRTRAAICSPEKPSRVWASRVRSSSRSCGAKSAMSSRSAIGQHACRLSDRSARLARCANGARAWRNIDHRIRLAVAERQGIEIGLAKLRISASPRSDQLRRAPAGAFPSCGRCRRAVFARPGEQLQHAAGAGTDINELADRRVAQHGGHGRLDLALCDVERADRIPLTGIRLEPAGRGEEARVGAHCRQPRYVGDSPVIGFSSFRPIDRARQQRIDPGRAHPAPRIPSFLPCAARQGRRRTGSSRGG